MLKPSEIHVNTFNEIYEAVKKLLNPDLLNDIRTYLTISKYGQYEILDGMLKVINEYLLGMARYTTLYCRLFRMIL